MTKNLINKKSILTLFIVSSLLGVIGALLKINHFTGANLVLTLGIILNFCFIGLLVAFLVKK